MEPNSYSASQAAHEIARGSITSVALVASCVTVPAYNSPQGLPLGVQIVGDHGSDVKRCTKRIGCMPCS